MILFCKTFRKVSLTQFFYLQYFSPLNEAQNDTMTLCFRKTIIKKTTSKYKDSDQIYNDFNNRKINHIVSVNILNENANLTDCKYAIFANYSSSEVIGPQRLGRSLRHKSLIIIMPYYENTREQEIHENMIKDFNKDAIYTIHIINDLDEIV